MARISALGRMDSLGRKLRCCGSNSATATARTRAKADVAASATRHDANSSTSEGIRRPLSPPIDVPAT